MRQWARQAVAAMVTASLVIPPGRAQAQSAPADPPARVGRLARISGTVSFHLAEADRWEAAALNLPVTTGFALWTEPGARAEVGIGGDRLVTDQSSELDITRLDDRTAAAALPQGALYWRIGALPQGDSAGVQTPRGQVSFMKPGRYQVIAGDTTKPTIIAVVEGEADVTGPGLDLHIGPNQAATITGDGAATPLQASTGALAKDAFLIAVLAEEQPPRRPAVPPPGYVARMTGGDALDQYGEWASAPEYGAVWYPSAPAGYVPYRDGHWAFVQPWGWTWVDAAPWGFAPSHYGRWVEVNSRWGWIPGLPSAPAPAYPVYAPAVVGFLAGAAAGALVAGRVGWVPLGPREPYYPPYRASNTYIRNVNVVDVTNVTNLGSRRPGPQPPFANRGAATLVPREAMVGSRSLAGLVQPVPAGAPPGRAVGGGMPIAPTRETLGVTPAIARRMNLAAAPGGGGGRPQAPGPALRTNAPGPALPPGAIPPGAALGGAVLGGAAAGAAAGALLRPRPQGLPPLREPGGPGGFRSNGGAPGPAIGPRPAVEGPRPAGPPELRQPAPAGVPRPEVRPEERPENRLPPPRQAMPVMPRPEARPEPRPEIRAPRPAAVAPRPEFQAPRPIAPRPESPRMPPPMARPMPPAAPSPHMVRPAPPPQVRAAPPPPRPAAPPPRPPERRGPHEPR